MRLIIIGSLNGQIGAASKIAMSRGAKVAIVEDIESALQALRAGQGADVIMVDIRMDVRKLVDSLASERINVPVVACGLGNDADAAVAAIRSGAKEYIPLPPDPELIAAVLEAVTEESHAIESGTGKELLARHVHQKSRRAKNKFIAVNCAAIPEHLLESELFGHEKGAFTGAIARRIGKFEEANSGTLLLDEISEMDPRLQAKLLRVIQEREVDRVGGSSPVKVDVRLIATSNRDLEEAVHQGQFREDLFFRLNVVTIRVPALRERIQDIELLAEYFTTKYAGLNSVPVRPLSAAAREKLRAHAWRGNVRELENAMHRAVLLADGPEVAPEAILLSFNGGSAAVANAYLQDNAAIANGAVAGAAALRRFVGRTVSEVECDLIIETLQHCLGNRTHAANILGISIRTLRNKLKQYNEEGVPVPMPGEQMEATA
jgi:two-component system response regulator FlrC